MESKQKQKKNAAAAKSLQSCSTLHDPIDSSLPGSSVPGILHARILEWGCHCLLPSRKMVLKNLFTGNNRETDTENRLMDMGRGEQRMRCMERVTWKHITICKILSQWKLAVWLRKLEQELCVKLEGWDWEADGREFQEGEDICIRVADSC